MSRNLAGCCDRPAATSTVQFHLSLNVRDLRRSVEFFSVLFGEQPAKVRDDYARFELAEPPLVLSLVPAAGGAGGNLNHLGFRLADSVALVEVQRRLEMAGIVTRREEGVACCYSLQTKFWVEDPDANLWELYVLEGDLDHRDEAHRLELVSACCDDTAEPAESVWEHRLGEKFPLPLFVLDHTVDRVTLDGTFNDDVSDDEMDRRLAEVRRILKPGGRLDIHALVAGRSVPAGPLDLPGPAAAVGRVRKKSEIEKLLANAGFTRRKCTYWSDDPWFVVREAPLHEARFQGYA
jgi:catechol 2,3-dioxygenase-like lactoylglutathione lyase family enzyme